MFNQDNVIRYAIEARNAHAYEVGKALDSYIFSGRFELIHSEQSLRSTSDAVREARAAGS